MIHSVSTLLHAIKTSRLPRQYIISSGQDEDSSTGANKPSVKLPSRKRPNATSLHMHKTFHSSTSRSAAETENLNPNNISNLPHTSYTKVSSIPKPLRRTLINALLKPSNKALANASATKTAELPVLHPKLKAVHWTRKSEALLLPPRPRREATLDSPTAVYLLALPAIRQGGIARRHQSMAKLPRRVALDAFDIVFQHEAKP